MDKPTVIRHLVELADLIEIDEGNEFQILAFRNAARSLHDWDGDLAAAVAADSLTSVDRIGKGIAKTITELVTTGRSADHDEIRARFPDGLPDLLRLPGLGPKKVRSLWRELGIEDLEALAAAARDERIRTLRGFGAKTEEKILAALDRRSSPPKTSTPSPSQITATPRRPTPSGRVRIGTSGYSHDEWRGSFYPEDLNKDGFLSYYAERLDAVEINNSFYRFPSERALRTWADQVGPEFLFAVKANRRISHAGRMDDVADVTQGFTTRCLSLGERLGCILVQFPPDLQRDDARLTAFLAHLDPGVRFALEFRHPSWFDSATLTRLRDHNVALVVHDTAPREVTADFVYARLRRGSYSADEVASWRSWFEQAAAGGRDVFAFLKHEKAGASPASLLAGLRPPERLAADSVKHPRGGRRDQA